MEPGQESLIFATMFEMDLNQYLRRIPNWSTVRGLNNLLKQKLLLEMF